MLNKTPTPSPSLSHLSRTLMYLLISLELHFDIFYKTLKNHFGYISMPILSSFCSIFFQKNTFSQTHVVFNPVILVISMFDKRVLKNTALKLVRNCFDIRPYRTKPTAALMSASRSENEKEKKIQ